VKAKINKSPERGVIIWRDHFKTQSIILKCSVTLAQNTVRRSSAGIAEE
jgi:hypothetical protein